MWHKARKNPVRSWSLALYCGALACYCKCKPGVLCVCVCVCVCGSPRVWETWQRGLFFKVWLYQCVFSVHSSHSFWKPSDQWELTSYISVSEVCLKWDAARLQVPLCVDVWQSVSLIAVVVVFVVTAERCETSQTDSIWEKYLGTCVHPYLQRERETERGEKMKGQTRGNRSVLLSVLNVNLALSALYATTIWLLHSLELIWYKPLTHLISSFSPGVLVVRGVYNKWCLLTKKHQLRFILDQK